jgi:hypothetical protein
LHLLLGNPGEACLAAVRDALHDRGHTSTTLASPLAQPARLAWRLDNHRSESTLAWDDESLRSDEIESVLILGAGWIDPAGWEPDDLTYVQSETHAALLAWLWSLPCPVVNRFPAAIWYRPHAPLVAWHGRLRRAGLPSPRTLLTNVPRDARAFAPDGAVYGALSSDTRYLVTSEEDWNGLAELQRVTPVCLTEPHGEAQAVCVVGERVVWDRDPHPELEPALRTFATEAGLACVELAVAETERGTSVVAVEPQPRLEHFAGEPRAEIVDALVELLT